jgi:hypothetical protein
VVIVNWKGGPMIGPPFFVKKTPLGWKNEKAAV